MVRRLATVDTDDGVLRPAFKVPEGSLPERLSEGELSATYASVTKAKPWDALATADTSASGSPVGLSFKKQWARRELFSLKLPIAKLDLSIDPSAAGGTLYSKTDIADTGVVVGYSGGAMTLSNTANATMRESTLRLWALRPFSTIDIDMEITASVYGNAYLELRSADGTGRVLVVASKHNGNIHAEVLQNGSVVNAGTTYTADVTGKFTLRVQQAGRVLGLWHVKDGVSTYLGRFSFVNQYDFRNPATIAGWTVGVGARGHTDMTVKISRMEMYYSGNGHADPRIVSYEDGTPVQEGNTVWFLATTRGMDISDATQGVYALDVSTGNITATGAIFTDRGDGIVRNDNAGHLFFDRRDSKWKHITIGHSDFPGARNIFAGETTVDLRYGINTTPVTPVTISNAETLWEDIYPIWDAAANKWVANVSKGATYTARLESAALNGPWTQPISSVGSSETGNVIVKSGGTFYSLAGMADDKYVVRDYNTLAQLGTLTLDYSTGATRVWPVLFPVKTGSGTRWYLLTFDRTAPAGNYSYGRLWFYRAG